MSCPDAEHRDIRVARHRERYALSTQRLVARVRMPDAAAQHAQKISRTYFLGAA